MAGRKSYQFVNILDLCNKSIMGFELSLKSKIIDHWGGGGQGAIGAATSMISDY